MEPASGHGRYSLGQKAEAAAAIKEMSAVEQMGYVLDYLSRFRGQLGTQQQLYMAVFYPYAMGWASDRPFPDKVVESNPSILTPGHYLAFANKNARLPNPRRAVRSA